MDLFEDALGQSHAVIATAKHQSSRRHILEKSRELARRQSWQFEIVEPSEGVISIDEIRRLYTSTAYRRPDDEYMLVVINEANLLSQPAQNAFLKLLEEPPSAVKFLLICPQQQTLLPTIRSRCQIINLLPLSQKEFAASFPKLSPSQLAALYHASSGDIIEAEQLLASGSNGLETAKNVLELPLGEAILESASLSTSREEAAVLVDNIIKLARAALMTTDDDAKRRRWLSRLKAGLEAKDSLAAQIGVKLVVDRLILELRRV